MLSMIPLPIRVVLFMATVSAVAFFAYDAGGKSAKLKLAEYRERAEKQISDLKDENLKISNNVVTEYIDRTNVIRERQIVYRDAATQLAPQQNMSMGWVYLHDVAAQGAVPNQQLAMSTEPSGIMDNQALGTVTDNYIICQQNSEQLSALQKWISDNQQAVSEMNGKQ